MPLAMAPKAQLSEGKTCDLTELRGVKLYYEVSGPFKPEWQGPKEEWLFLLMGSVSDLRRTTDQQYINLSAPFFKVLTYDHRNTGQSTIRDEPCTMEDYADDAAALLQTVLPDRLPVYVLGVSFGGMVAQHLALRHPSLVKKLVLCCCTTGGEGGTSYPISDWYAPGVSVEERVVKKIFMANSDRNEEWQKRCDSEWQMVRALLLRDEQVGADTPLRDKGILRQLEARGKHDTWERISELQMDVLCCGSHKDLITPASLIQRMAERIGSSCQTKLDFDYGHPFIAADATAMSFVNEWLRRSSKSAAATTGPQVWHVVGGADKGGIVVRIGPETSDAQVQERLSTGALVEQLELRGDRLRYKLLSGAGPAEGWVLLKLGSGKELLVKTDERP